ncbi:hypothetical protein SVA_3210 [Sulfurifustis variabilis]|uniref:Copper chaperone n=1 Tax=Sulfurifustis variabilis TaxID=1675686 RepID=A0A1C7AEY4_9GAMM|nr:hypothetical protein [Sulfurifustis variabilis]BAU49758.1 hypothetical protein SVA_3210 [Sulfurifustis variabilis]
MTRAVKSVDPEARVQVDLGSRRVRIEGQSTVDQLTRALAAAGYPAAPAEPQTLAASTKGGCCCH